MTCSGLENGNGESERERKRYRMKSRDTYYRIFIGM